MLAALKMYQIVIFQINLAGLGRQYNRVSSIVQTMVIFMLDYRMGKHLFITHFKLLNKNNFNFFLKVMVCADAVMGMVHLDWLVLMACHVIFHVLI